MDASDTGVVPLDEALGQSGLSFLRGLIEGRYPVPPFAAVTDCRLTEATEGRAVFTGRPGTNFLNPLGGIHGGWTAGILDSAMACAVHTTLEAGAGYTTLEFRVHLVRGILPTSGELTCEGRIVHRGGQTATSEGFLRDGAGRLLAHGTETCLIFDARRARRG